MTQLFCITRAGAKEVIQAAGAGAAGEALHLAERGITIIKGVIVESHTGADRAPPLLHQHAPLLHHRSKGKWESQSGSQSWWRAGLSREPKELPPAGLAQPSATPPEQRQLEKSDRQSELVMQASASCTAMLGEELTGVEITFLSTFALMHPCRELMLARQSPLCK